MCPVIYPGGLHLDNLDHPSISVQSKTRGKKKKPLSSGPFQAQVLRSSQAEPASLVRPLTQCNVRREEPERLLQGF